MILHAIVAQNTLWFHSFSVRFSVPCRNFISADSDWCHDLREAVEYPVKVTVPIYDEIQFPPVKPIAVE